MSLDELRDYALSLEQDKQAKDQLITDKDNEINTLKDDVVGLQRRNNELFLRVQQQVVPDPVQPTPEPEIESVEDATRNRFYKEIIK